MPTQASLDSDQDAACSDEILIVDDDVKLLEMLDFVLTQRHFRTRSANSGTNAIALYEKHREAIKLVMLDLRMPDVDGLATLSALQKLDPAVRAVFLTGERGRDTEAQLLAQGALHVLHKPILDYSAMIAVLKKAMKPQAG